MIKDKVGLVTFSTMAGLNAAVAAFSPNPTPQGIAAIAFALLAIAWAPKG